MRRKAESRHRPKADGVIILSMGGVISRRPTWQSQSLRLPRSKTMPLTRKGGKIKRAMVKQYGARKGARVFYASANKGTIRGVHRARRGK
jgi:hypothetical protein